jgi:MYXO-CTERM domain-containing protein
MTYSVAVDGADPNLYGVRVAFDGTRMDPFPFPITTAPGSQNTPAEVAFNGTDWLVVWSDTRNGSEIYAARVASDGTVRDPNGIGVAVGSPVSLGSSVASNGNGFIVTWHAGGLQAAIVDANGTVARRFTIQSGSVGDSRVAFNGTHYLVAYSETVSSTSYLRARRLTPAGDAVGDVIEIGTPASPAARKLASDGSDWLVTYRSAAGLDYRIIESDGSLGASGSLAGSWLSASLTWSASSYLVSGVRDSALVLASIDATGGLLRSESILDPPVAVSEIVHGGGNAFVAFLPQPTTDHGVVGSRVDSTLALLDGPPKLLSVNGNTEFDVRSAGGASGYLAVWRDYRNGNYETPVHARLLDPGGQPLGPSSFALTADASHQPDVASDGEGYLAVWRTELAEVRGTRVSASGAVLDNPSVFVANGGVPTVASNGSDYYVTWLDSGLYGARVLADGSVGARELLSLPVSGQPAIAWNGAHYLVVWSEQGVKAKRVDGVGTVLDATAIDIAPVGAGGPRVASDGTSWFVVWQTQNGIRGARVARNGAVQDAGGIAVDDGLTGNPFVTWTGESYLIAWVRAQANIGIHGRHLSACAELLEQTPFQIATEGPFAYLDLGSVTGDGLGSALVPYTWPDTTRTVARRARVRTVTGDDPGECGEGGAGGAGTGGSSGTGPGGRGGSDAGAAGESSGGAGDAGGEGSGGTSTGGTSGRGSAGSSGTTPGGGMAGTAGGGSDDDGQRDATDAAEGCGCRTTGTPTNRSALLLAFVAALGTLRRKRKIAN